MLDERCGQLVGCLRCDGCGNYNVKDQHSSGSGGVWRLRRKQPIEEVFLIGSDILFQIMGAATENACVPVAVLVLG